MGCCNGVGESKGGVEGEDVGMDDGEDDDDDDEAEEGEATVAAVVSTVVASVMVKVLDDEEAKGDLNGAPHASSSSSSLIFTSKISPYLSLMPIASSLTSKYTSHLTFSLDVDIFFLSFLSLYFLSFFFFLSYLVGFSNVPTFQTTIQEHQQLSEHGQY